jgi:tetratricopeptide (TPR) repeat protein
MNLQELQEVVFRNTAELAELRKQLIDLVAKEKRVEVALAALRRRLAAWLDAFHRARYQATDQRLLIRALAEEILIFDKLGYDLGVGGARFLLGIAALLEGRHQAALDHLHEFIAGADSADRNLRNAAYLAAMICYNRRDFSRAIEHFEHAFRLSPEAQRDWQCQVYVGELQHFLRRPQDVLEKTFRDVEDGLRSADASPQNNFLRATLYLKWGNCYVGTLDLEPRERNALVNNPVALALYKQARKCLPKYTDPDSLLPVVIDYSLAQALLLARSVDMDLAQTPSELLADAFHRLRRIVLSKREEIILAQCYLMLGTCAFYSSHVSGDVGEIYLEYARTQTLSVPSDVCFYSPVTKELLSRDELVRQIDYYANHLEHHAGRR